VGYTLDELDNDITRVTPASFEPTIDYVVTKIPKFAFEKFPGSEPYLTTAMKSVGEAMAIGRTIHESMQKALASMESGLTGFDEIKIEGAPEKSAVVKALAKQTPDRIRVIAQAMREGLSDDEIHAATAFDPWFLARIREIIDAEAGIRKNGLPTERTRSAQNQNAGLYRCASCHPDRAATKTTYAAPARTLAWSHSSSVSIPVLPNLRHKRLTCTPLTKRPSWARPNVRRARLSVRKLSSWVVVQTGSAKGLSLITAVATRATR
jgi:hypothetical protein